MPLPAELLTQINRVWTGKPEHQACLAIAEYLTDHIEDANRIPLTKLNEVVRKKDADVTEAAIGGSIGFLTNSTVDLLRLVCFLHLDEEGDYTPIDYSDARAVLAGRPIVDPKSGETIEVGREQVLCFFSISDNARRMLRGQH